MKYLLNSSTDPYFNMALDEFCLENIVMEEPYFYLWRNRPSVIIGLNQNAWSEVNLDYLRDNGITLARRVTGGGAVYHDLQNLNYTIVGQSLTPQPIIDALLRLGCRPVVAARREEAILAVLPEGVRRGEDYMLLSDLPCDGFAPDIVVYTLPGSAPVPEGLPLEGAVVLEAEYRKPRLATFPCRRYISGRRWLFHQAVTAYRHFTGEEPDVAAMESAIARV